MIMKKLMLMINVGTINHINKDEIESLSYYCETIINERNLYALLIFYSNEHIRFSFNWEQAIGEPFDFKFTLSEVKKEVDFKSNLFLNGGTSKHKDVVSDVWEILSFFNTLQLSQK